MEKRKILFVTQEITPFIKETPMSLIGRWLPQGIQERGREIRTFMPRYGNINERRNQLHEVIRLSGMNLIIDDTDHPLIIKVASIQSARMQIYFIDNDDYFKRKAMFRDKHNVFFSDNDERVIFYARGVLETAKKLAWAPDIVHCHGWFSYLIPIYVKRAFRDNPIFSESKVIISLYDDSFEDIFNKDFARKLKVGGITLKDLKLLNKPSYETLTKLAITYSDGIIITSKNVKKEYIDFALNLDKPVFNFYEGNDYIEKYNSFYSEVMDEQL